MEGLFAVRTVWKNWNTTLDSTHKQRRRRPVLYDLRNVGAPSVPSNWAEGGCLFILPNQTQTHLGCNERVGDQTPKERRNGASMDRCEDDEDIGTLGKDRASG